MIPYVVFIENIFKTSHLPWLCVHTRVIDNRVQSNKLAATDYHDGAKTVVLNNAPISKSDRGKSLFDMLASEHATPVDSQIFQVVDQQMRLGGQVN